VQEECTVLKRPLIVVRNSTERPEAIDSGFAHLVQPGPAVGELGRRLINDTGLSERLEAIPCPFGDGLAGEWRPPPDHQSHCVVVHKHRVIMTRSYVRH
jgi:UDP-N-acetylglucosamine 2-epimerase (non-hydrolysing)